MGELPPRPNSLAGQLQSARDEASRAEQMKEEAKAFAPKLRTEVYSLFGKYIPSDPRMKSDEEIKELPLEERIDASLERGRAMLQPKNNYLQFEIALASGQPQTEVTIHEDKKTRRNNHAEGGIIINVRELPHVVRIKTDEIDLVSKKRCLKPSHTMVVGGYNPSYPEWRRSATVEEMNEYLSLLKRVPDEAKNIAGWRSELL